MWGGKDTALGKVQAQSAHIYGGLMHNVDWGPTLYSVGGGDPSTIIKEHHLDGMVTLPSPSHFGVFHHRTQVMLKGGGAVTSCASSGYLALDSVLRSE